MAYSSGLWWGLAMAFYSFLFIRDGQSMYQTGQDHADDLDALEEAENLSGEFEVEVWRQGRLVARIKKGNAPLNTQDRVSG
jgi:hypothetical protein